MKALEARASAAPEARRRRGPSQEPPQVLSLHCVLMQLGGLWPAADQITPEYARSNLRDVRLPCYCKTHERHVIKVTRAARSAKMG